MSGELSRVGLFQAPLCHAYGLWSRLFRHPILRRLVPGRPKAQVQEKLHGRVVDQPLRPGGWGRIGWNTGVEGGRSS